MSIFNWIKENYRRIRKAQKVESDLELHQRNLRWAKARLSVKSLDDFEALKDWFNHQLYYYFEVGRKPGIDLRERDIADAKADLVDVILTEIEVSDEVVTREEVEIKSIEEQSKEE